MPIKKHALVSSAFVVLVLVGAVLVNNHQNESSGEHVVPSGIASMRSSTRRSEKLIDCRPTLDFGNSSRIEDWTITDWDEFYIWVKSEHDENIRISALSEVVARNPSMILEIFRLDRDCSDIQKELSAALWRERNAFSFLGSLDELFHSNRVLWEMFHRGGELAISQMSDLDAQEYCSLYESLKEGTGYASSLEFYENYCEQSKLRTQESSQQFFDFPDKFLPSHISMFDCVRLLSRMRERPFEALERLKVVENVKSLGVGSLFSMQISKGLVASDPERGLLAICDSEFSEELKTNVFKETVRQWLLQDSHSAAECLVNFPFDSQFREAGYLEISAYLNARGLYEQAAMYQWGDGDR